MVCRLYVAACVRWAPDGLTISALAWRRYQRTGDTKWRDRIDGAALVLWGERDHCEVQFQIETANTSEGRK